jgi:hypothetical protein
MELTTDLEETCQELFGRIHEELRLRKLDARSRSIVSARLVIMLAEHLIHIAGQQRTTT